MKSSGFEHVTFQLETHSGNNLGAVKLLLSLLPSCLEKGTASPQRAKEAKLEQVSLSFFHSVNSRSISAVRKPSTMGAL